MEYVVEIKGLKKYFRRRGVFGGGSCVVKAVNGVDIAVKKGETFGLVGESGCGKTTLAKLIAGILRPSSGEMILRGEKDMVFQDPYSSLNPRMNVGQIIGESLFVRKVDRKEIEVRVKEALGMVKLAVSCASRYPHQFSGGERQRIAIARAIVRRPDVVILDEPVSSLDVSIQAGILNLLKDIQRDHNIAYIFISHDLRVVEFMSDRVAVMKEGVLMETASKEAIYSAPASEYTRKLLKAIPAL